MNVPRYLRAMLLLSFLPALACAAEPTIPPKDPYPNHGDLLVYHDDKELRPVETEQEWAIRRGHILLGMQAAMGELPGKDRLVPLDVRVEREEESPKYIRRKLSYAPEAGDRVPAFLLIPKDPKTGKAIESKTPAILCLHPTSPLGKAQVAGLEGNPTRFYGHELAERGFVCLIPDYPSFGDYEYDFTAHSKLYASGTMKAIWNNMRGVDLLISLPIVDQENIGCIGHSLGGHNALFTAAFDDRIKATVTSCGFTAFADYYQGDLTGWTSDRYMPRIKTVFGKDPAKMPFDFHEVLGMIAPRYLFVAAPLADHNFDNAGVRKVVAGCQPIFDLLDAKDKLTAIYPDCKHDFPDDVRNETYDWLEKTLR